MLISNYLYHRRMPVSEPWIGEPFEGDQCAHEEHDGAVWRASGLPPLAPARSLCEELLGEARRRSGNARLSLNRALNALDEADGLKFEAARLYAGQTWWVTIMTGNACAARDDPRVLQTSMAELRGNEGAMFGALRHLGFGAPDRFPGFNLTATTARAMKSVLWSSAPEEFRKQHYTARDVTPERRAELVSLLLGDAVLGALVNHTQAVLDRPREACPDLSRARRGRTVLF